MDQRIDYVKVAPEGYAAMLGLERYITNKARALIELSAGLANGRLDLEGVTALDDQEALARLYALRGVGRWTAEYVLLRGLR